MPDLVAHDELNDDVLRRLESGESLIVTRDGIPVGELLPLRRNQFVSALSVLALFRNAPSIDTVWFIDGIDGHADQTIEPLA